MGVLEREAVAAGVFGWMLVLGRLRRFGGELGSAWAARRGVRVQVVAAVAVPVVVAMPALLLTLVWPGAGYAGLAMLTLGAWLGWSVVLRAAPEPPATRAARSRAFARGAAGWLLTFFPFVAWSFGLFGPYWSAVVAALAVGLVMVSGVLRRDRATDQVQSA